MHCPEVVVPPVLSMDDLPGGGLYTDGSGLVLAGNAEFCHTVECLPEALEGSSMDRWMTGGARIFAQTHLWPLLRKNGAVRDAYIHLRALGGHKVPMYVNAKWVWQGSQRGVLWLFFAAEERRQFEEELIALRLQAEQSAEQLRQAHDQLRTLNQQLQAKVHRTQEENLTLERMAQTDSLTQLGNRRSLELAAQDLGSGRAYSLLMIDVDHFKRVNDMHGHSHGDKVLRDVALCVSRSARQGDTAVRYGGEEFALLLPQADAHQAWGVAERIHQAIAELRPGGLDLTVSIGVATSSQGQLPLTAALEAADKALYRAKHAGRNRTECAL